MCLWKTVEIVIIITISTVIINNEPVLKMNYNDWKNFVQSYYEILFLSKVNPRFCDDEILNTGALQKKKQPENHLSNFYAAFSS